MSGTYRLDLDTLGGATSNYFSGRTVAIRGTLNVPIVAKSIQTIFQTTMTFTGKVVIWRVSDATKVAESVAQNLAVTAGSMYDISLSTPVTLSSGVEYAIGVYSPGTGPGYRSTSFYSPGATFTSTPTYVNFSKSESGLRMVTGDAHPINAQAGEVGWGLYFDAPNALPNAPTGLTTNSPVMTGNQLTANWTHNDPDGNPQNQYQLRWRKIN